MLAVLLALPVGLWLFALLCQRGLLRFAVSFRTRLPAEMAFQRYDAAVDALLERAQLRFEPTDDANLQLLKRRDGKILVESYRFETGSPNSIGLWERDVDRTDQPGNWVWCYAGASTADQGSRFTYAIGPGARLSSYLVALLFSAPRYWLRMRRPVEQRVALVQTNNNARTRHQDAGGFSSELFTSLLACISFVAMLGWRYALFLIPIILIHEYGHVLAYRLTGKQGNRMMLVPFFGGIAIAGCDHKSEAERAFCAIMGPAICVPITFALIAIAYFFDNEVGYWAWYGAWICGFMNAANLLPALPLDGGHSLESTLRSIAPTQAGYAMLVISGATALLLATNGYQTFAFIVALWGLPAIMRSFETPNLYRPMTIKEGLALAAFHIGTFAAHAGGLWFMMSDYFY